MFKHGHFHCVSNLFTGFLIWNIGHTPGKIGAVLQQFVVNWIITTLFRPLILLFAILFCFVLQTAWQCIESVHHWLLESYITVICLAFFSKWFFPWRASNFGKSVCSTYNKRMKKSSYSDEYMTSNLQLTISWWCGFLITNWRWRLEDITITFCYIACGRIGICFTRCTIASGYVLPIITIYFKLKY